MSEYVITRVDNPDELYHHGVKGMKWGKRKVRYDSSDNISRTKKSNTVESENGTKKKGLSSNQKKALKVGAAVAGTALAAYGTYKVHQYIRGKNQEIRINEGKTKCDRMLRKLNRMEIKDKITGSSGTEKWANPRSYKRTGAQYNNNGKTVKLAREYLNTQPTLKSTQYDNIVNRVAYKTVHEALDKAENDSFAIAAKNVAKYAYEKRKNR